MLPDERVFVAEPDSEAVLNRQAVARVGGDRGVEALNRGGQTGATTMEATFRIGSRAIDRATYDVLQQGGLMRAATRALRPRGRHSPWKVGI